MILINLLSVAAGLLGLFLGGEWLVRSASRLATSFSIPSVVIGLTVVSVGTSLPELVVSVSAALRGSSDIAMGNVVGSNIANIGLILGISGLISPLLVHISLVRREIPIMIGVTIVLWLFISDGQLAQLEGLLFLATFVVFTFFLYRFNGIDVEGEAEVEAEVSSIEGPPPINRAREVLVLVVGLVLLVAGAQLTVDGAVNIARSLGVSELVIGLTLVAVGTSLPELATSAVAAYRGHVDIAVGNVVGSNIANILLILGATSVINPINVNNLIIQRDMLIALIFAVGLLVFVLDRTLQRWQAGLALLIYFAITAIFFIQEAAAR
ncbi:MAG: calcium/sodium antiporter [Anaerolineae bacterium]|nr:calcium/sodium antiporter [Anaerolineae bacterium]MDW8172250.1 calcium/sodium antiporter [Anaerolineae bacterium]